MYSLYKSILVLFVLAPLAYPGEKMQLPQELQKLKNLGVTVKPLSMEGKRLIVELDFLTMNESVDPTKVVIKPSPSYRVDSVELCGRHVTDKYLKLIAQLPEIEKLALSFSRITDEGLRVVGGLPHLKMLWLAFCPNITAKGLNYLRRCPVLDRLDLSHTEIGSKALETLKKVPKLSILDLTSTPISDKDVQLLVDCRNLAQLSLSVNDNITDKVFMHLRRMPSLEFVNLSLTAVGRDAVKQFGRDRPKVRIYIKNDIFCH